MLDCDLAIERDPKGFAAWLNRGSVLCKLLSVEERINNCAGPLTSHHLLSYLLHGLTWYTRYCSNFNKVT